MSKTGKILAVSAGLLGATLLASAAMTEDYGTEYDQGLLPYSEGKSSQSGPWGFGFAFCIGTCISGGLAIGRDD